jgi:hypothetical protein
VLAPVLQNSYWQVAPHLGQQATAEYQFRQSPSYQRLIAVENQLVGYREAVQTLMAGQQQQEPVSPGGFDNTGLSLAEQERRGMAKQPPYYPKGDQAPPSWVPEPEKPPAENQTPPAEPLPPQQPSADPDFDNFKANYPTIAAKCASCHGQKNPEEPDGGLYLNGGMSLDDPARRDLIIGKLRRGEMPPDLESGHRLQPEVLDAIEDELYGVQLQTAPST